MISGIMTKSMHECHVSERYTVCVAAMRVNEVSYAVPSQCEQPCDKGERS